MSDRAACPYAMSFTMLEVQRCWNCVLNHLDGAPLNVMELVGGDHVLPFSSQIVGDAVGWGFVVRGSKPCHIQAVDPSGPAAAAGMKVRFLNGIIYWGYFCCSVKVLGCLYLRSEQCFCFQGWVSLSQFQVLVRNEFCCLLSHSCLFSSVLKILQIPFSHEHVYPFQVAFLIFSLFLLVGGLWCVFLFYFVLVDWFGLILLFSPFSSTAQFWLHSFQFMQLLVYSFWTCACVGRGKVRHTYRKWS